MDNINNTLDQCQQLIKSEKQQSSGPKTEAPDLKQDALMIRLWQRMTEIYGHRWLSSYGSTPNDSWVAALGEMPANELKTGLDTMLKECLQWPPTLTEFISFCRKPKVDPSHKLFALPKPCNIDREEGKKRAAELMKMMKGEEG